MSAEKQESDKASKGPAGERAGHDEQGLPARQVNIGNLVVFAGAFSVLLSIVIGLQLLTPVLLGASGFPFLYTAMKKGLYRRAVALTTRWAITVYLSFLILSAFVPDRAGKCIPFAAKYVDTLRSWIGEAAGAPPVDYSYLLLGIAGFVVAAALTRGALALILGGIALSSSAFGALYLFRQGDNIFHILIVALTPWQLCLFAAALLLLVPAASLSFLPRHRSAAETKATPDKHLLRLYAYVGSGLFLLSLILRLATAETWRALTDRWTLL